MDQLLYKLKSDNIIVPNSTRYTKRYNGGDMAYFFTYDKILVKLCYQKYNSSWFVLVLSCGLAEITHKEAIEKVEKLLGIYGGQNDK